MFRGVRWIPALALLTAVGCVTPTQVFLHQWHRGNLVITEEELRALQFYVSTDVMVRTIDGGASGARGVIFLKQGTPGVVVDSGDRWMRVSFQTGGRGVGFAAIADEREDSAYWFASEAPGEEGYQRIRDLRERKLYLDGVTYEVVSGANARLLVNDDDLKKLIGERTHIQGRTR